MTCIAGVVVAVLVLLLLVVVVVVVGVVVVCGWISCWKLSLVFKVLLLSVKLINDAVT